MKKIFTLLAIASLTVSFGQDLAPDQNPNYQISQDKYMQKSDELTAAHSTTIQDTYKAYDWREAKEEQKQLRRDRRFELRKMRIQSRYPVCCNQGYRRYGNQGWNQPTYYCYPNYNYGYNNYYANPYWNSMYLGAGLYSIFF